jgi:hypothetical protein
MNLGGAVHPLETPLPMLMSNRKALEVILLDLLILSPSARNIIIFFHFYDN